MNNWRVWALLAAIGLQLLVLAGELVGAAYPHWLGQPLRLLVEPVDPRSLFRGNYARLRYDIGELALPVSDDLRDLRDNERVYVQLKVGADGVAEALGLRSERPDSGLFIRGRLLHKPVVDDRVLRFSVRYGVEAYFLPRQQALALEQDLRSGKAIATLMLAADGKAALETVELIGD